MNKEFKMYFTTLFLTMFFGLLVFSWLFVGAIAKPSGIEFNPNIKDYSSSVTLNFDYHYSVFDNGYIKTWTSLSPNGILVSVFFSIAIFFYFFNMVLIGKLNLGRGSIAWIVLTTMLMSTIVYLFGINMHISNVNEIIANSFYNNYRNLVISNPALSIDEKNQMLMNFMIYYNITPIEDLHTNLLNINSFTIASDNLSISPSFIYHSVGYTNQSLIYFTITIGSIILMISFIFYLIVAIQLINALVKEPVKQVDELPKKRSRKPMIVAPDPSLEQVFVDLDL
ncbi:hypothetical protein [Ureaplasma canigenitalium]|uniref:hypothetical protein n=1 Tax=Ureaplasma canigenitalium TaxID=42092 RepID=UPI0004E18E9B|nr:hypothetical protein [Ureaplasma canigenitalium]